MKKLAILGAGSWGLTLASLNASVNKDVIVWDRKPEKIAAISENRDLTFPLTMTVPEPVKLTSDLSEAIKGADAVLLVVTSAGTRDVAKQMVESGCLQENTILVNCSKGIEYPSLKTMSQVLAEECPANPSAVMSGPCLAAEILKGLPTAGCIASRDDEVTEYLQIYLNHEKLLRLYSNSDVTGVELGGALKNIIAIASGYVKEKQLGDNAWASLITRGLAEMTRFAVSQGAQPQTLYGLSGLGDLLATCNSPYSRNYQVGSRLAKGQTLEDILKELKVVAEGVKTTEAVARMGEKYEMDIPIVTLVSNALKGNMNEEMVIQSLMSRKLKSEGNLQKT